MTRLSTIAVAVHGGALAILSTFCVSNAVAQEIGPPFIAQGYYQQSSSLNSVSPPTAGSCNSVTECYVVFDRVPVGQQLVVTQVSCILIHPNSSNVRATLIAQRPTGAISFRQQQLALIKQPFGAGATSALTVTVLQLFDERDRPLVKVEADVSTVIVGSCTIAGQRKPKP